MSTACVALRHNYDGVNGKGFEMQDDEPTDKDQILNYCFSALEYVRTINPELLKRAQEFAEDQTGVQIESFKLEDCSEDEDGTIEIEEESPFGREEGDEDDFIG